MDTNADLLTYVEAAQALGISEASLRTAIARGNLHPVKVPGIRHKFLRREEIAQYRSVRPVRPGRHGRPELSREELQALLQTGTPAPLLVEDASQQRALELLRTLVIAAQNAWTEIAAVSRRSVEEAEAARRAVEAHERALRESTRIIAATGDAIRDILTEALHLYLPLLQRGRLLPPQTQGDQEEGSDSGTASTSDAADTSPAHTPPHLSGRQLARTLTDDLLSTESDAIRRPQQPE